jgi:hypothetical protein
MGKVQKPSDSEGSGSLKWQDFSSYLWGENCNEGDPYSVGSMDFSQNLLSFSVYEITLNYHWNELHPAV